MNLDGSFRELHEALSAVLQAEGLATSASALDAFVAHRRPPLGEVLRSVGSAGFAVEEVARRLDAGVLRAGTLRLSVPKVTVSARRGGA